MMTATTSCLSTMLLLLAASVVLHSSVTDAFSPLGVLSSPSPSSSSYYYVSSTAVTARSSTFTFTSSSSSSTRLHVVDVTSNNIESWRQYVPLVVSVGIIGDILLGSPLANMIMAPMRPENREDDQETILAKASRANVDKSKERIDTEKYAQAAIDKARNTLELRQFLDERKTDWDKMEDMKRKLDADMQDLDQDLADRNADFENRKSK